MDWQIEGGSMINPVVLVNFDASNKKHRNDYYTFIKENTWAKSKTRYMLEHPFVDIPSMIQHKLLNYYLNREFNKEKA